MLWTLKNIFNHDKSNKPMNWEDKIKDIKDAKEKKEDTSKRIIPHLNPLLTQSNKILNGKISTAELLVRTERKENPSGEHYGKAVRHPQT